MRGGKEEGEGKGEEGWGGEGRRRGGGGGGGGSRGGEGFRVMGGVWVVFGAWISCFKN